MSTAKCRYFGVCGGCSLQNLAYSDQIELKQQRLQQILAETGQVSPEENLAPLFAHPWAYRHRARLSVRCGQNGESVRVGFRDNKKRSQVMDMDECPILPDRISDLLPPLRQLIGNLGSSALIPQIDVIATEQRDALVFRHLDALEEGDRRMLRDFSERHKIEIFLQSGDIESIVPLNATNPMPLNYTLDEFDLSLQFHPAEFTQVNPELNNLMVSLAVKLMAPEKGERIADLFCGIGNFSLPLAQQGALVTGMEFSEIQVQHACDNAERNGLASQTEFRRYDLSRASQALGKELAAFDKLLLDPPRSGAPAVIASLQQKAPRRIVYVSCNPHSLAKDAKVLVTQQGYLFKAVGLIDMFPQTNHMEAIAVFDRLND